MIYIEVLISALTGALILSIGIVIGTLLKERGKE